MTLKRKRVLVLLAHILLLFFLRAVTSACHSAGGQMRVFLGNVRDTGDQFHFAATLVFLYTKQCFLIEI